jgi:hypothetical protein
VVERKEMGNCKNRRMGERAGEKIKLKEKWVKDK